MDHTTKARTTCQTHAGRWEWELDTLDRLLGTEPFRENPEKKYGCIESPPCTIKGDRWVVRFYPRGLPAARQDDKNWVSMFVVYQGRAPTVFAKAGIAMYYKSGASDTLLGGRVMPAHHSFWPNSDQGWLQYQEDQQIPHNKKLVVKAWVEVAEDTWTTATLSMPAQSRTLHTSLGRLLDTGDRSDVTLRSTGEDAISIAAHTFVLSLHSPVFATMFANNLAETATGTVEMEGMPVAALQAFVRYLYTEDLHEDAFKYADSLLEAAHKYDAPSLGELCRQCMCQHVTVDNAAEWAIIGHQHEAEDLKQECRRCILAETTAVLATPRWREMCQYPELMAYLLGGEEGERAAGESNPEQPPAQKKRRKR